ncbi:MAG TPA: BON domain-containing protein [Edaphocola sp.]|nr:BON domain-containing protein [Edaphocola sp.]
MTIKKLIPVLLLTGATAMVVPSCKSNVPDATVQSNVEAVMHPGVSVSVKDGVVTLSGTVNSEADKIAAENAVKALDAKKSGVKSINNNIEVAATPAPVVNAEDAALSAGVSDVLKDFPSVSAEVKEGIIYVNGEIEKAKVTRLKQMLDNLKPIKTDMSALKVNN